MPPKRIATPGSDQRIRRREPHIDISDVAVALCPFFIGYELQGTTCCERGTDFLLLSRSKGEWRVVWRSMQTAPAD